MRLGIPVFIWTNGRRPPVYLARHSSRVALFADLDKAVLAAVAKCRGVAI